MTKFPRMTREVRETVRNLVAEGSTRAEAAKIVGCSFGQAQRAARGLRDHRKAVCLAGDEGRTLTPPKADNASELPLSTETRHNANRLNLPAPYRPTRLALYNQQTTANDRLARLTVTIDEDDNTGENE